MECALTNWYYFYALPFVLQKNGRGHPLTQSAADIVKNAHRRRHERGRRREMVEESALCALVEQTTLAEGASEATGEAASEGIGEGIDEDQGQGQPNGEVDME